MVMELFNVNNLYIKVAGSKVWDKVKEKLLLKMAQIMLEVLLMG